MIDLQVVPKSQRFVRAVRLDQDLLDPLGLEGYVPTPVARRVARALEEGLRPGATERAWTITGPYGSGKSSFALFFARLAATAHEPVDPAWELLERTDPVLAEQLARALDGRSLLPVVLTLRRAPFDVMLREGLRQALQWLPMTEATRHVEQALATEQQSDSRALLRQIEAVRDVAIAHGPYRGLLLVLDELGKGLEYAARQPGEDLYVLQELAETASRSGDQPLLVVGILHQAFEHYGERLDSASRKEWAKVQGRFRDVAFVEPPEQQMHLAGAALAALELDGAAAWQERLTTVAYHLIATGHAPTGLKPEIFVALAARSYPLHPTLLMALPYLFRRLAQNERSLFTYLHSPEPFGIQETLRQRPGTLARLPDLFDYVAANLSGSLARNSASRRWLEVLDALERAPDLPPLAIDLLKTIGVLTMLGAAPAVKPTRALLALALRDRPDDAEVSAALDLLRQRSLVVFRRFNQTFRIWEGSDVDVEARVEAGWQHVAGQPELAESLQRLLPYRPLVARRHSYETGALRVFELRYLDAPVPAAQLQPRPGYDGLIVCCLPVTPQQAEQARAWALSPEIAALPHVLVVVPAQIGMLRDATDELRALRWAWDNTPELRDDRVARRELAERIALAEQSVQESVNTLLDPRPAPVGADACWIYRGQPQAVATPAAVSALLSTVMDELYAQAPRIRNELINRRELSSAAAAARRTLIERMLTQADQPELGISGFPPERSMYASLLQASGLHRQREQRWSFGPPPPDDPQRLGPVWAALETLIFAGDGVPRRVDELFAHLAAPPYGLLPGVAPVLLAAFLLAYRDEISLYREGTFVPEPSIADFEVLLRRPELFAVAGARVAGPRLAVVQRLARGLEVEPAVLPVVRALLRRVRALPEYAWRTRRLSPPTLALRSAIERAREPERFLFHELPMALGEPPFPATETVDAQHIARVFDRLNAALQEWQAAWPRVLQEARDTLLRACGQEPGAAGWNALRALARQMTATPVSPALRPFVLRLGAAGDADQVLESVLALVAEQPPRAWGDTHVERFPLQAAEIGERWRRAVYQLQALTPAEEQQAQALLQRLRTQIDTAIAPQVRRVALLRLLEELETLGEEQS
ncbi:hypothetical protein [Kallotenue papyrolyticum]|uniref:hypothetical protein n=1 Tax=Kallotenue papyrolyticum TaxID=1325125 RepID=UPI00047867D5|nr:hypothetical protein [Kallotenue papyrolyticum]